jgi:sugar phosphate isomerase/epimerase
LKAAAGTAVTVPLLASAEVARAVGSAPSASPSPGHYFDEDYLVSMSLYCFNENIDSWIKNRTNGAPPLTTSAAIAWAKGAGFDGVDVAAYYIPGYDTHTMPTLPTPQIVAFAQGLRDQCEQLNLRVTGTGAFNDFADPNPARRALDVQRLQFWTDIAAVLGAPAIRVFSGVVPVDMAAAGGWEGVTTTRIVPALQEVTSYAASAGIRVLLQNHGDMTATADQTIQMLQMVGDPNISIIDDTGYFRPFLAGDGADYNYYADIDKVVPYSTSIQVKRKPGGETSTTLMDYGRLFTGLRLANYHDVMPLERLWAKTDPDNPKNQPTPPYAEVVSFLAEARAGLAQTKDNPFDALVKSVEADGRAGAIGHGSWDLLVDLASDAGHQFDIGDGALALQRLQAFGTYLASPPSDVSAAAAQALTAQQGALLLAATDVFG